MKKENLIQNILKLKKPEIYIFLSMFIVLTLSFYFEFHLGNTEDLSNKILPGASEPKIYGRLAQSMNNGILSEGALTGFCYTGKPQRFDWGTHKINNMGQMSYFYKNQTCPNFETYKSHPGFQGIIFHFIGKINDSPQIFKLIAGSLFALMITLWLAWLSIHFGKIVSILTFFSLFLFAWLLIFGDNIGFFLGTMYMPMILLFWTIEKKKLKKIGHIIFYSMFVSCLLGGAEFIFSRIVMAFLPLVFYRTKEKWNNKKTKKIILQVSIGIFLACVLSLGILMVQIASVESFSGSMKHLAYSIGKRTYGGNPDNYAPYIGASIKEPILNVLSDYFQINAIYSPWMNINFKQLINFFLIISIIGLIIQHKSREKNLNAWLITTWISLLGPLSWLIISKAHAHVHRFVDPLVWFMPFVLFGMALTALILKCIYNLIILYLKTPKTEK